MRSYMKRKPSKAAEIVAEIHGSLDRTDQMVRNLRESNYRLQKICDSAMQIPWVKEGQLNHKLLQIAAIINSHFNGGTDAKIACEQIGEVLGEPF